MGDVNLEVWDATVGERDKRASPPRGRKRPFMRGSPAIAEACMAVRQAWQDQESRRAELQVWGDKAATYQEQLEKDREAMEGADIELAVGNKDSADKAHLILGDRLKVHSESEAE